MSYYKKCPHCGASLDPGEICDCQDAMTEEMMGILRCMTHDEKVELLQTVRKIVTKQEAAPGVTSTQSGKVEQICDPVSTSILSASIGGVKYA